MAELPTWNSNLSALIREWAAKAQLWSILHAESARRYEKWSRLFGVPLVLINTFTTSSLFAILVVEDDRLVLATAIIQFLATVIGALSTFLNFSATAAEHDKSGSIASNLAEEISYQLALPDQQRLDVQTFIAKIRGTLDSVRDKPPVSGSVLQKYGKLFDIQTHVPVSPVAPQQPSLEFFAVPGRPGVQNLENQVNREKVAHFHSQQLQRLNTLLEQQLKVSV